MGAQLSNYYSQAYVEFGIMGRMKLAMLTKISSEKAQSEPDTPQTAKVFEDALNQLRQDKMKSA